MTSIRDRLAGFFSRRRRLEFPGDADVVRGYRKLVRECPVCDQPLDGHGQHRLAVALVAPPSPAAVALAEHVAERRWKEAAEIGEWRWDRDAREYHVIRCPNAPGLGLVTAHYPYWGPAVVEESRPLPDEDAEQISRIVGGRWQPL